MKPFKLERYFAKHEFSAPYMLSCSDCEPLQMSYLLKLADFQLEDRWNNLSLGYTESKGDPLLREEILSLYRGMEIENIINVVPEEGIYITINSLLERGDEIVVTYPAYQTLYSLAEDKGVDVKRWFPKEDGFDFEDMKSLISDKTKMIIINFPHNPTGFTIDAHSLHSIIDMARERGIYIFSDEMYRLLEYRVEDRLPSVAELYERGISLSGVSKSLSLPGLRVGWLLSKDRKIMERLEIYKDFTTICGSAPSEVLATIGLRNRETILKRNIDIIESNINSVENFIKLFPHIFSWRKPKAGSISFMKVNYHLPLEEMAAQLIEKKGVVSVYSSLFDFDEEYLRVGLGRKNLKTVLYFLEEYLRGE